METLIYGNPGTRERTNMHNKTLTNGHTGGELALAREAADAAAYEELVAKKRYEGYMRNHRELVVA